MDSQLRVAHFSFANAQGDAQFNCSPQERLEAIYAFFQWAMENKIDVIGCTEGNRAMNKMDWIPVHTRIRQEYGYHLYGEALLGDQSEMSFSSQLFVRYSGQIYSAVWGHVHALTPFALDQTRWAVRAPKLKVRLIDTKRKVKLIYCHLSLSRNAMDDAYDNLLYELRQLEPLIKDGWIAFGDFNLTYEVRKRLTTEEPQLMANMAIQFGSKYDISFITFPHDRIPTNVFADAPEFVLTKHEDGSNCVSALDVVCSQSPLVCRRYLPWAPFQEVPLDWDPVKIVHHLQEHKPPENICEWVSDHWILTFSV